MTARDFCYWLQGYFEIKDQIPGATLHLTENQVTCIRNHLNMVFKHEIDPSMGPPAHQHALTQLHQGGGPLGIDPKSAQINC